MLLQHFAQAMDNFHEAARTRPTARTGNGAVRQGVRKRFGPSNHAIAGAAQRRIEAENNLVRISVVYGRAFEDSGGQAARAAEAVLHLLKLLRRNAHRGNSANCRRIAKEQRRNRKSFKLQIPSFREFSSFKKLNACGAAKPLRAIIAAACPK